METVTVQWHGPYSVHSLPQYDVSYEKGLYVVSTVTNGKERLLYIGKTTRSFHARLKEHRYWLDAIRGQCRIRLGKMLTGSGLRYSQKRLADVEELLIVSHAPKWNTKSMHYYYGRDKLTVLNIGRRGLLYRRVTTEDLEWA